MAETVHVLADGDGNLFAVPHSALLQGQVPDTYKAQVQDAIGGDLDPNTQPAFVGLFGQAGAEKPDKPKPDPPKLGGEAAFDEKPDKPKPDPPKIDANTLELRSLGAFRMEAPAVLQQKLGD